MGVYIYKKVNIFWKKNKLLNKVGSNMHTTKHLIKQSQMHAFSNSPNNNIWTKWGYIYIKRWTFFEKKINFWTKWGSNPRPKTSALSWRLRPLGHLSVYQHRSVQDHSSFALMVYIKETWTHGYDRTRFLSEHKDGKEQFLKSIRILLINLK